MMNTTTPTADLRTTAPGAKTATSDGRLPIVELAAVTKIYETEPPVTALRSMSLRIMPAEYVAIVGPSGSGKTTLLQIMGTLDRPTSGAVRFGGIDVADLSDRQLATLRATRIGFVFQQFFLAEHTSIVDNVGDGLLYAGFPASERRRHALEALDRVGLAARARSRPNQLSGGQRQRVAIARALVGDPALVLADEPTGNLDSATGASILALLDELHRSGVTIAVITHDQGIAARLPRRVELLDGRVVADTGASDTGEVGP